MCAKPRHKFSTSEASVATFNSVATGSRPENASSPSVPGGFASIEGNYNHPGYGNWFFCSFEPDKQPSAACKDFAGNLSVVLPGAVSPTIPTLIAPVDSVLFNYVRLEHFDGNVFNVTFLRSYVCFSFCFSSEAGRGASTEFPSF